MPDNLKVLESSDALAVPVRTIDIGGVHYPVYILSDINGVPIESKNGAISIHNAIVHNIPVNELIHRHTGIATTLSVAITAGDTSIEVVNATDFSVSSVLKIQNGVSETTFPAVTNIAANTLTLDRPLNKSIAVGSAVDEITTNMNVSGTLASPVSFKVNPDGSEVWNIISFILSATFSSAADDSKFGNLSALTNGCVLRGYNGMTNSFRTLTVWKTNSDIKLDMYDVPYTDKVGGGKFGMNGNGDILNRTGAAPKLDASNGDYIELLIQDDLSSLSEFRLKVQGRIET